MSSTIHYVPPRGHVHHPPEVGAAGPAVNIANVSAADRKQLAKLWGSFGTKMIPMHKMWHSMNGSGGTQGPRSGEKFMQFHANLMSDFLAALKKKDAALYARIGGQIPSWDTAKALPKELWFKDMEAAAKGEKGIDWKLPGYLTAKGGGTPFTLKDSKPEKQIKSLNDISSADELGRVLGSSGAHAVGHVRLGGQMNTFSSVGAPPFMLWHGKMEEIRHAWLKTPAGKKAAKAHPPEGWLDNDANHHDHVMAGGHKGMPAFTQKQVVAEMERLARQQR